MRNATTLFVGVCGLVAGVCATAFYFGSPRTVGAARSDRYQDYVMVTGAVSINPRIQTDGVWLLDYRSGKLLGTVIDKNLGKIVGWAEVDLAEQFDVSPKADVHFIMTTGYVTQGQAALYIAETTSGKFGIYTMGPGTTGVGVSTASSWVHAARSAPKCWRRFGNRASRQLPSIAISARRQRPAGRLLWRHLTGDSLSA